MDQFVTFHKRVYILALLMGSCFVTMDILSLFLYFVCHLNGLLVSFSLFCLPLKSFVYFVLCDIVR